MGRTRTAKKVLSKASKPDEPKRPSNSKTPSTSALLEKAQSLIVQCDYDLAQRFVQRALEQDPSNAQAKEMLGVVFLEKGDLAEAKETFLSLIPPAPGAPAVPPPSAHLYLAQLSDDDPYQALRHYQAAVDILFAQLKGKNRATDEASKNDEVELKSNIVRALIGQVEIWMDPSYDLCFDPIAEKTCEDLIALALETDPGNPEALQSLSSIRMSQQRPEEAKQCLEQAWAAWKDLDLDDPKLPPIPSRLSLVKLFIELSLYSPALLVLQGVIATDDQEVEAWYLEGWCFYLMSEQAKEDGGKMDDLTWQELGKDSRDCLETCQMLHTTQNHPDAPLLEHVKELISKLDALGITVSSLEEEEGDGEEESWEDVDSEDDDGDVDME